MRNKNWLIVTKAFKVLLVLGTSLFLFFVAFFNNFQFFQKSNSFNSFINVSNPNLSIESLGMQDLLRCKWWFKSPNQSEEDAIKNSNFNITDCSNYYPKEFARKFFIYIKNVNSITMTGVVVKSQDSNDYIIPSVVAGNSIDTFEAQDRIQKSLLSNDQNTPLSLFQRISSFHNRIMIIYELPFSVKLEKIYLGVARKSGIIEINNSINISASQNDNLQIYMGYLNVGDNIERVINDVDSSSQLSNERYQKFLDTSQQVLNSSIRAEYNFVSNQTKASWNRKAFKKNIIPNNICVNYIQNDLGITSYSQVNDFCSYLANVYSKESFYLSDDFLFNPNNTLDLLGDFINPIIDGDFPLSTLPWDLIYFPHKKASYKSFNFQAIGDIFLQKLVTKYANRNNSFKLVDLSLINLNLNLNTIETFLFPFFQKGQLEILDFSNNKISYITLETLINQPYLKKLVLKENFFSSNSLDLNSLTLLEDLIIDNSSFSTIELNSSNLRNISIQNVGLNQIHGLDKSNDYDIINLNNNNLINIEFALNTRIKSLLIRNNKLNEFVFAKNEEVEILDLSKNQIENFNLGLGRTLKELYLKNNNVQTLALNSNVLTILDASYNPINLFSINTDTLKVLNLEGVLNAEELLNRSSFIASNLEKLNLSDSQIGSFNESWIGTNNNPLSLILSNTNEVVEDNNNIESLSIVNLPKLESLFIHNIGLKNLVLTNVPLLKKIDLSQNLSFETINYNNNSLVDINISSVIPNSSIFGFLRKQKNTLEKLNISNTTSDWSYVFGRDFFSRLKILDLSNNLYNEVPNYFLKFRSQLEWLSYAYNDLRNRFDAFGYTQLKYLDLSGNVEILAIINLGNADSLNELKLRKIPRVIDRITEGNDLLKNIDISYTETRIVKPLKLLFPNTLVVDISGNNVVDLSELVGVKNLKASSSTGGTNEIINELPAVLDVFFYDSPFNLLKFIGNLTISKNIYNIYIDENRLLLDGDMELLNTWFNKIFVKQIFLFNENKKLLFLNNKIIERYFLDFGKKYDIKQAELEKYRQYFDNQSPILTSNALKEFKNKAELYLNLKFSNEVVQFENKINNYKNSKVFYVNKLNETLETFKIILYSLAGSIILLAFIIIMILAWLLKGKKYDL